MYTRKIVWSKSQINIELIQEILSNSNITSNNETPTFPPNHFLVTYVLGMSSILCGSIHREINDFDVISICQYAQSMCGGPYAFAKPSFFSGKNLPQKTVNGILTISTTCYIRHMCLFRSTLFRNKSTK